MRAPAPPRASRRSTRSPGRERRGVAHGRARRRRSRSRSRARAWPAGRPRAAARRAARLRSARAATARCGAPSSTLRSRPSASRRETDPVVGAAQRGSRGERLEPLARAHDGALGAAARARAQPLEVLELLARVGDDQARGVGGRRGARGRRRGRTAARRARARRPRRRRVEQAAIARQSPSSENGSRSSSEPPPRVITITSTSARASSAASARRISGTARSPCTAVSASTKRAEGRRARALRMTSSGAAASRPRDQADAARPERQRALAAGVEEPVGVEPAARLLDAREQRAVAGGLDAVGAQRQLGALVVERHLAVHLHALALDRRAGRGARRPSGPSSPSSVAPSSGVAQREEDEAAVRVVAQIADLALDPQRRQLVDAPREAAIDVGDACRRAAQAPRAPAATTQTRMRSASSGEQPLASRSHAWCRSASLQRDALGDLLRAAGLDEY